MILFFAGFSLSLFGSLPPGLISLSVAQTSIYRGMLAAMRVAAGAASAEFFQAWAAVALSDWFLRHPAATLGFQWASLPVFLILGTYLFFFARSSPASTQAVSAPPAGQFAKGIFISTFNLLAVPYWFVYCGWLRVEGWWQEGLVYTLIFAAGVSIGTLAALWLYAWLGQKIVQRSARVAMYANRCIGVLFWAFGLKTLWELMF